MQHNNTANTHRSRCALASLHQHKMVGCSLIRVCSLIRWNTVFTLHSRDGPTAHHGCTAAEWAAGALCHSLGSCQAVWLQDDLPQKSTTYHNLPPEGTDCAECSQNWRTNSCAFLCNMFDLHHAQSSRRYFDRKYFNRRMRFFIPQACVCCHFAASIYPHCTVAKWRHTQAWRIKNASSD